MTRTATASGKPSRRQSRKPRRASHTNHYWAAKQDDTNQLDGRTFQLCLWWWKSPKVEHGTVLQLFSTRSECRAWIEYEYGYLRRRPDLKREPFCWRMPRAVKVTVEVTENA